MQTICLRKIQVELRSLPVSNSKVWRLQNCKCICHCKGTAKRTVLGVIEKSTNHFKFRIIAKRHLLFDRITVQCIVPKSAIHIFFNLKIAINHLIIFSVSLFNRIVLSIYVQAHLNKPHKSNTKISNNIALLYHKILISMT